MKNDTSSKRRMTGACVVGALLMIAAAGCSHHETGTASSPLAPPSAPVSTPIAQAPTSITIYKVAESENQAKLGDANGLIAVKVPAPQGQSPEQVALAKLASEPDSPLPQGTKVLAVTTDNSGLATVDFSSEFQKNFAGGDTAEAQVVNSVLQTLGQFPNIQNVQFLVEQQKIDSLGGTQDLSEPLPVIRPDQETAAKPGTAVSDSSTQ